MADSQLIIKPTLYNQRKRTRVRWGGGLGWGVGVGGCKRKERAMHVMRKLYGLKHKEILRASPTHGFSVFGSRGDHGWRRGLVLIFVLGYGCYGRGF